jgi:hypothetical protein
MRTHAIGKTTVSPDNRLRAATAELMPTRHAGPTTHARTRKPAKPHSITDSDAFHLITSTFDYADDLVSCHKRIRTHAPLIIDHRKIRMTNPARFHTNLHIL